ncbi:hypothetical protein [Brachyspira hyodysenteriae]|nr:hypothetical protein [Brachyspira hyodysenteriae]MDA0076713.1 hypothetical protein [Brachyspira hyodysenteriae]
MEFFFSTLVIVTSLPSAFLNGTFISSSLLYVSDSTIYSFVTSVLPS